SYQIVLTKADKLKKGEAEKVQAATLKAIAKRPAAYPAVLVTSAEKGDGLPELRAEIMRTTGVQLEACQPARPVVRSPDADPLPPDRPPRPADYRGRLRPSGSAASRIPGTVDQLAAPGRGPGRRRLSRRRPGHARLWRDRQAGRPRRLWRPRPGRRHGRPGAGPGRDRLRRGRP